jgi:hypothetical protein
MTRFHKRGKKENEDGLLGRMKRKRVEVFISTLTRSLHSPPSPITKGEGEKKENPPSTKEEGEKRGPLLTTPTGKACHPSNGGELRVREKKEGRSSQREEN